MKKEEILLLAKELFELDSKKEAEAKITEFDKLVKAIAEKLEVGSKAKIGSFIEIAKKHVDAKPAKDGEMTRVIDGVKTKVPYTTEAKPEHDEIRIKQTKLLNKAE